MPDELETMMADLARIGSGPQGLRRPAFGAADAACREWFADQARARDLRTETDGNGNLLAWWEVPESGPAVLTGSHLDAARGGGGYDGALGVAGALAAIDLVRARGRQPRRSVGVAVLAATTGSRFGACCLGSRLATGQIGTDVARGLTDGDGVALETAMRQAGIAADLGRARWPERVGVFVELHLEQGRDLAERQAAVGLGSGIWPRARYRYEFTGSADHAGSAAMAGRHDPMQAWAMTVLAANKRARTDGQRATFAAVEVEPNRSDTVPSRVTGWLDARARDEHALGAMVAAIARQATDRARRDGVELRITAESVQPEIVFDQRLVVRLARGRPVIPTAVDHDAGALAAAGIRSAMFFVRNPSGVTHAPQEYADPADCSAGVLALAEALEDLACTPGPDDGRAPGTGRAQMS